MDVSKYIPVGEQAAIDASIIMVGITTLTGKAWREDDAAQEVKLRSTTALDGRLWIIGFDNIAGISVPEESGAQPVRTA